MNLLRNLFAVVRHAIQPTVGESQHAPPAAVDYFELGKELARAERDEYLSGKESA